MKKNGAKKSAKWIRFCSECLNRTPLTAERYIKFFELLKDFPKLRRVKNVGFSLMSKNGVPSKLRDYFTKDPQGIEIAKNLK